MSQGLFAFNVRMFSPRFSIIVCIQEDYFSVALILFPYVFLNLSIYTFYCINLFKKLHYTTGISDHFGSISMSKIMTILGFSAL